MSCDELILDNELHREVSVLGVQRVIADLFQTIGQQDVRKVGNSSAVAEASMSIVKPVHIDGVREDCEAQMAIAQCR